jgi:hypothetical protein
MTTGPQRSRRTRIWEDASQEPLARAQAILDAADSRGATKALGDWLDGPGADLRHAVVAAGLARGAALDDDAAVWPGKRLLRLARARAAESQARSTPIAVDEAFDCLHCGASVPAHGRTARNHCPKCLWSLHVDVVPGDRAAGCGGGMEPVGVEIAGADVVIHHLCVRCGARRRVRSLADGAVPDDWSAVVALSARGGG